MVNIRRWFKWLLIVLFYTSALYPCTTAIVSGKYTADGRPILFKHRDTGQLQNKLMYFTDGDYDYIGLVNAEDVKGEQVWAGYNSAGFAIMNSASYNINQSDTIELKDQEGFLMKKALQKCSTVSDFEELLKALPKPLGVEANFGVIDAQGGAAYFETGHFDWIKYDANDSKLAPFGYLIRSNYSFSGTEDEGYGYIRYQTADQLFYQAAAAHEITPRFIITKVSRCLRNTHTGTDLWQAYGNKKYLFKTTQFVDFQDYIPRYYSSASFVVHGVNPEIAADEGMIWTVLGFPLCSVALPVWLKDVDLPQVLTADASEKAPLSDVSLKLKDQCYPVARGSGLDYLNIAVLINGNQDGILQKLMPLEQRIFRATEELIKISADQCLSKREIRNHYQWMDEYLQTKYLELFDIKLLP